MMKILKITLFKPFFKKLLNYLNAHIDSIGYIELKKQGLNTGLKIKSKLDFVKLKVKFT